MKRTGFGTAVLLMGIMSSLVVGFAHKGSTPYPPELTFIPDAGVRIDNGGIVASSVDSETGMLYLYYQTQEPPHHLVATSVDGVTFSKGVVPREWLHDPRVLLMPEPDKNGRSIYRRYLAQRDATMISESSSDGIHFTRDFGVRYRAQPADRGTIGVYDHFVDSGGGVVLLYIGDMRGANNVRRAYSPPGDNGWTFQFDRGNVLGDEHVGDGPNSYVDQKSILLPDGRRRLFVMKMGTIYSFLSEDDGVTFTKEPGTRLAPSDFPELKVITLHDPWVVRLPDGRYRMYLHGAIDEAPGKRRSVILSATTPEN